MLRLYTNTASHILACLVFLSEEGRSMEGIRDFLYRSYRGGSIQERNHKAVERLKPALVGDLPLEGEGDLQSLIDLLTSQLGLKVDPKDGDLIDQIVAALRLPYNSSVLGGRSLDLLKRAILLPEERAAFSARITQQEWCCGGCGKDLAPGEMVSLQHGEGNNTQIFCAYCSFPVALACQKRGEHRIDFPEKVSDLLQKAQVSCPHCEEEKKLKKEGDLRGQPGNPPNWQPLDPPINPRGARTPRDRGRGAAAPPAPRPDNPFRNWTTVLGNATAAGGANVNVTAAPPNMPNMPTQANPFAATLEAMDREMARQRVTLQPMPDIEEPTVGEDWLDDRVEDL